MQFPVNLKIKFIFDQLPLNNSICFNFLLFFQLNFNLFKLLSFFCQLILCFLLLFLFNCPVFKLTLHTKIYLPKYSFYHCCNYQHDNDVHQDEIEHYESKIIRISFSVIKGNQRPTSFSQNLNHNILGVNESIKT
jgi:hypothetical protein